jgi:hypothetical protein
MVLATGCEMPQHLNCELPWQVIKRWVCDKVLAEIKYSFEARLLEHSCIGVCSDCQGRRDVRVGRRVLGECLCQTDSGAGYYVYHT